MSREVLVSSPAGTRRFAVADLPVRIGLGGRADIRVPGPVTGEIIALVSVLDDRLLLQKSAGEPVLAVNGEAVSATRWLADGDVITVDNLRVECHFDGAAFALSVAYTETEYATLPPVLGAPAGPAITPAPVTGPRTPLPASGPRPGPGLIYGGLALLALLAFLLFTSHPVRFNVDPPGASLHIVSPIPHPEVAGSYLLRAGSYQVEASAPGYRPLAATITVTDAASQSFALKLEEMPGRLAIEPEPGISVEVQVDGRAAARNPAGEVLVPAGTHVLRVVAERYRPFEKTVQVEGKDRLQKLPATLEPNWADVRVTTAPDGATILADGQSIGTSPATVQLVAGSRDIEIRKDGFKPWRRTLTVTAGQPVEMPTVELEETDGLLSIASTPPGAAVTIDGRYRGTTPLDVDILPGRPHAVLIAKAGYDTVNRSVAVERRSAAALRVDLPARVGTVRIVAEPADAELIVDGQPRGGANQEITLPAVSHRIEVRKPGFASYAAEVTPQPGVPRQLDVKLLTPQQAVLAASPKTVTTSQGALLRLIEPGEFTMGAPRREQGRRPNETEHPVRLTRRFYLGTREVTNREFREFRPNHTSGAEKYQELAAGQHPVVMVSWEDAVAYSNWLSDRESLPHAYVQKDGTWRRAAPPNAGYRLPTEAEWEWASRYNGGAGAQRYPWGEQMPPVPKSGNYADRSAQGFVPDVMADYDDGYPVTAPVASFPASPLGLYDIGGNAAEWVSDIYTIYASGVLVTDPEGPEAGQYHAIRGSSWRQSSIGDLRLSARDFGDRGRLDVGFRLARSAE